MVAVDSVGVSMTSSGIPVEGGTLCWVISDAKRRPNDGDHTQGRLSETHSDNCIQLTQFPKERNGSTEWRKVRAS